MDNPFHLYNLLKMFFSSFYIIPHEIASLLRLAHRFPIQSWKPLPESTNVELEYLQVKNILVTERPIESSNANMERVLRIEHLLLPIAASLHYTDLVNLGRTSRAVKEAVFPCQDMVYRKRKLREASCAFDLSKTKCWNCMRQICEVCVANDCVCQCADNKTVLQGYKTTPRMRSIWPSRPVQTMLHEMLLYEHMPRHI
jgi:hypothetical protein